MRTLALLPVKAFADAKQRLAPALEPGARRALAESMFTDVLIALRRADRVEQTLVITGESAAAEVAKGHGAMVVEDPRNAGQSAAAAIGIRHAVELGYPRVLLVPGDTPAVAPADIDALLDAAPPGPSVVVVADRHGTGTNALVLSPPNVIEPSFGPGSRDRHRTAPEAAGARCEEREVVSLGLDVDTPEDLAALREHLATVRGGAAHTRGMLHQLGRTTAPAA